MRVLYFFLLCFSLSAWGVNNLTLSASPAQDFGSVVPPADSTVTLTLSNNGNGMARNISGSGLSAPFTFEGGGAFPGSTGTCTSTLNAGATCTIRVTFDPTNTNAVDDTLVVSYEYSSYPGITNTVSRRVEGNQDPCGTYPVISSITPSNLNVSSLTNIQINGAFFSPTSTVSVTGLTTGAVTYVSSTELTVNVTTSAATGFYDLVVTNECGATTSPNAIQAKVIVWVDLRSTGDSTASLGIATSGVTYTRDATGMYFGGAIGWGNWVQFRNHTFTRGANNAFEFVFTKIANSAFMVGIGSDAHNFGSGSQWNQAETMFYTYGTVLYGFYGNNGTPGNTWNQVLDGGTQTLVYTNYYKVRFEFDGANGNNVILYQVNPANWDFILSTINTTVSTNNANETNLEPTIIPYNTGTNWRAVGFKIE